MGTQEVSGASPLATGLSSAAPIEPVPVSPVPASIPSALARKVLADCVGHGTKTRHALETNTLVGFPGAVSVWQALDAMERYAQAIKARRAETQSGSVHESAVPQGCAQPQVSETPSDTLGEKAGGSHYDPGEWTLSRQMMAARASEAAERGEPYNERDGG